MSSTSQICGHTPKESIGKNLYQMNPLQVFNESDTCQREVWGESNRCILHADGDSKPANEVSEALSSGKWLFDLNLRYTDIIDVQLTGASIVNSDLRGCYFSDVSFHDCDFWNVYFTDSVSEERIRFSDCQIHQSDFRRVGFPAADFQKSTIPHTRFDGARLTGSNFQETRLNASNFNDSVLDDCNFIQSGLFQTSFKDAQITKDTKFGKSWYETQGRLEHMIGIEDPLEDPLERAAWQHRMLSRLHRENSMLKKAKQFYLRAKNSRRKEYRRKSQVRQYLKAEASRLTTNYGESPWRVVGWSIIVILVSAGLFELLGGVTNGEAQRLVA